MQNYDNITYLERGRFAQVVEATHKPSNTKVALKKIWISSSGDYLHHCAQKEIDFLKSIKHPNVIQLWEHFLDGCHLVLALELLTIDLYYLLKYSGLFLFLLFVSIYL